MNLWLLPLVAALILGGPQADAAVQLQQLDWLEGHWEGTFGDSPYEERHTSPRGGQILWMSKTYRGDRVVFFEFGTFEVLEGAVVYIPFPRGSRRDPFRLRELGPGDKAVFENPSNDFPTRFTFESPDRSSLNITLSGPDGKAGRTQKIEMKRVE